MTVPIGLKNQIGDKLATMTDENWIERLQGGEPGRSDAISDLRRLLVRGLSKSLTSRYGSGIQPDDVVQEALVKILGALDSFEGRSRFTTWAMTIATRVGISELRRKHFSDVSLDSMTGGDNLRIELADSSDAPPHQHLDRRTVVAALQKLVATELTEKQRAATQGLLDGLPVEEIARRSNSNRNAVYKLIHDARARLRDGLEASGISRDDVLSILS